MLRGLLLGAIVGLSGCSGGGTGGLFGAGGAALGTLDALGGCIGFCGDTATALTQAEVQQIIAQARFEAVTRSVNAVIAVVDRVGNPLAVYDTSAANNTAVPTGTVRLTTGLLSSAPFSNGSLDVGALANRTLGNENVTGLAALSKAITAAYLSSEGNAFTTRTANQIVQESFNPGESSQPGGPLFGVQFSQLACSDLTSVRNNNNSVNFVAAADGDNQRPIAPRASPLGLAADPGGLPLYKGGVPVGGIGVLSDGIYGIDRNLFDVDSTGVSSNDEAIALAGTNGFSAPSDRRADRITVDGKTLRFSDNETFDLQSSPANAPAFQEAVGVGFLVDTGVRAAQTAFFDGSAGVQAGQAFGTAASGVMAASAATFNNAGYGTALAARDAFVLTDAAGNAVYEPRAGNANGGQSITAAEATQLVLSALDSANATRAQIRRPVNSQMRATVSLVDFNGRILALARTRDGPMFGTDVSLQKARTATFFSRTTAAAQLQGATVPAGIAGLGLNADTFARRVRLAQGTDGNQNHTAIGESALQNGIAFADRSGGNISRPSFPDGVSGRLPGPFSNPIGQWSPFATGLQLELVLPDIELILFGAAPGAADFQSCDRTAVAGLDNGIQIFPGSVPVFKNGQLVGGLGVSGDGIDQDDMTAFLGTHNAGVILASGLGNAPAEIRADTIAVQPFSSPGAPVGGPVNLRYIQCPQGPFLNSSQQQPCDGK